MKSSNIINKKRKSYTSIYSFKTLDGYSTKELITLVEKETNIILVEGRDYDKRTIARTRLKVLSILNSPNRTVFNNPKTFEIKL